MDSKAELACLLVAREGEGEPVDVVEESRESLVLVGCPCWL